ncbi:MAG: type II toxin-antitoxin system PemK/MazF family toxin [Cyanobacteria bacterium J06639_1]
MQRGDIWWADLPAPVTSEPGFRRPVLIVQANAFNRSRIRTAIAIILTSNLRLAQAPGNLLVPAKDSGLPKDSVANVSKIVTADRSFLTERVSRLSDRLMQRVDDGLRLVLSL